MTWPFSVLAYEYQVRVLLVAIKILGERACHGGNDSPMSERRELVSQEKSKADDVR